MRKCYLYLALVGTSCPVMREGYLECAVAYEIFATIRLLIGLALDKLSLDVGPGDLRMAG